MLRVLSIAMLGFWCAACTSNDGTKTSIGTTLSAVESGLSAQELAPGECGLFLWTASEPRKFMFFSKAGSDEALVDIGGEAVPVARTSAEGEIFGQFMTEMSYDPGEGKGSLSVFIVPGALLDQGQRTEAARLTFTDTDGWETIVPVAGVRACQNEP